MMPIPVHKKVMFAGDLHDAIWFGTVTDPRDGSYGQLYVILLVDDEGEPYMHPTIKWMST